MKKKYLITGTVFLIILALSGALSYQRNQQETAASLTEKMTDPPSPDLPTILHEQQLSSPHEKQNTYQTRGCTGSGSVPFSVSPRKTEDLGMFAPMGLMTGDHVTPIDHGYFYPPNWKMDITSAELKDVYVPATGVITTIQRMPAYFTTTKQADLQDYRVVIHHTCTFYTIYIHLNLLAPKIQEAIGDIQPSETKSTSIPVAAGELLGRANAFDFSAHNDDVILPGFATPAYYEREPWKIHTIDPFAYFTEPIRTQILAKNPRTAEPRGGKIDYDTDGKLIGNWFLKGTNGYAGVETQPNYWTGHLAFAPDAYDPTHFTISLGEDQERHSRQYGAKGNTPDPAHVDVASGLIKYELVAFDYTDSTENIWDARSFATGIHVRNLDDQRRGTLLVQLLAPTQLKIELFPEKTPADVSGFTTSAKMYYR